MKLRELKFICEAVELHFRYESERDVEIRLPGSLSNNFVISFSTKKQDYGRVLWNYNIPHIFKLKKSKIERLREWWREKYGGQVLDPVKKLVANDDEVINIQALDVKNNRLLNLHVAVCEDLQ